MIQLSIKEMLEDLDSEQENLSVLIPFNGNYYSVQDLKKITIQGKNYLVMDVNYSKLDYN